MARAPAVLVTLLVAGSAVVFDPWGWMPFGPSKWLVVTVLAWAALAAACRGGVAFDRPSGWAWGAVLAWAAVSALTAAEPLTAWLGTPDRRFGFVGLATVAAAFWAGQALASVDSRRLLARGVTVATLAMVAYGAIEAAGGGVALTTTADRLGATFGSPAYLGAALCLFLPVCVGLAVDATENGLWRAASGLAAAGGVVALGATGTRAALAGLVVAVVVVGTAMRRTLHSRTVPLLVLALLVAGTVAVSPLGERLVSDTAAGRVDEWRVAGRALAARPVLGAGPEGYRLVFPAVVDGEYVRAYGRSTVTDRAHSAPLDVGIALGVPGMAAWTAAAVWLTTRSWRAARRNDSVLIGLGGGVVAYLVQSLFLFPTVEVGVAAWAVAGCVVAATATSRPPAAPSTPRRVVSIVAGIVAAAALVAGALDVTADRLAARGRETGSVSLLDRASTLRPDSFRYPLVAADVAAARGDLATARARVVAARRLAPLDPALRLAELRVAARAGAPDALDLAEAAVAADPNHPLVRRLHGDLLAAAGRAGEAERAWLAAEFLAPGDPDLPLRLALLYLDQRVAEPARLAIDRLRAIAPDHPRLGELESRLDEL